jgi:hypothetical protein
MLWRFVQTNSNLDLTASSNRYYLPWSKAFLAQTLTQGGLNAQDYDAQLTATLAKWILKLTDPRHLASWKALPFYFFEDRFPGMGLSIFSAESTIIQIFGKNAGRWFGFLQAWLQSGFYFAAPPKDYQCILNESIWFNLHLTYLNVNKKGRPFGKPIEDKLIRCGFTHIFDLLSSTADASSELKFISFDEAQARTGSKKLAKVIHKIIYEIIPFRWLMIVNRKIREPFQAGEWFIEESASTAARPAFVFKVRNITQSLLLGEAYSFSESHTAALRRCSACQYQSN